MEKNKEISVVTGASGRIGFALCHELKTRGEYVRALCRGENKLTALIKEIADEVVFGDVTDYKSLEAAFENSKVVYHLAGVISIESRPSELLEKVNVGGTRNVIDACKKNGVQRLVFVSSVHAVPYENKTQILTEPARFSPELVHGAYAKSKADASNLVLDAVNEGLNAVIAMPSGVIGPFEYAMSNFGQMIADVAAGKLKVYVKGEYDFVDARDVCIALCDLSIKGVKGESYFIGGHKAKVKELLDIVSECAGVKKPRLCVPTFLVKLAAPFAEKKSVKKGQKPTFTPYSIRVLHDNCNFSRDKLTKLTGYTPRPLKESLKDQTDFYFENLRG